MSIDSRISCMFNNVVCNIIISNNMNYSYVIIITSYLCYKTESSNMNQRFDNNCSRYTLLAKCICKVK